MLHRKDRLLFHFAFGFLFIGVIFVIIGFNYPILSDTFIFVYIGATAIIASIFALIVWFFKTLGSSAPSQENIVISDVEKIFQKTDKKKIWVMRCRIAFRCEEYGNLENAFDNNFIMCRMCKHKIGLKRIKI